MFSNNKNEQDIISRIIANRYEINLVKIELIGDKIYTGKGVIYQNEDGKLLLKFFSDRFYTSHEQLINFFDNCKIDNTEGGILSDYYSLKGFDENGFEYNCKRLSFKNGQDSNLSYLKLMSSLESNREYGYYTRVIFSGTYSIPENSQTDNQTIVGQTFYYTDYYKIWELKLDNRVNIVFSRFEDYLDLVVITNEDTKIDYQYVENLIYSLNFVVGIESEPIYINIKNVGYQLRERKNFNKITSMFSSPLIANHCYGDDFTKNHTELYYKYFQFLQNNPETLLKFIHKRIVSVGRSYLYALALILSVQIENICKEYYYEYYHSDEVFNIAIKECSELIDSSNIKNKNDIIARLKGMVNKNSNRQQMSVVNILKNLAEKNYIDPSLIKPWKDLRNITAHGDYYKDDGNNSSHIQLYKDVLLCTNLFYQLVFHLIGYHGFYSWKSYEENKLKEYPICSKDS